MSELFISREQAETDLLAASAYIGERIKSSDGHAEALNAILPLYLAKGEVDIAAELANSVDDPFSRDKLLTMVAETCAAIDDAGYALQLAEAIEDIGLQSQAMERVALVLAGKGEVDQAVEIADTMAHPDFVIAGVAASQAASGDFDAARSSIDTIEFPTARVAAMQHIAASLIESGDLTAAVGWLDSAVGSANEIEHDEERIRSLTELAGHFVDAKRNDRAVETLDAARSLAEQLENTMRDFFLGGCSLGFLSAGSKELAEQTLDLITDKTQMASALVGFARESWKAGDKEEALDTIDEAQAILKSQREIEIRDSKSRNRLMTVVAVQFAGFGKTERGIELAHENPDPAEETEGLSQIAQILVVQKEDDLARQTINEIAEDSDQVFALIALADAKSRNEDVAGARTLLNDAASLAETVPQLASRVSALSEIGLRLADQGETARAAEIAIEELELILEIKDRSSQAVLLASVSEWTGRAGVDLGEAGSRAVLKLIGNQ